MVFKAGFVVMAPDVDPKIHRASIKTSKFELTTVLVELMNFDQAGFPHEAVAEIANAVGEGVAVNVARGDVPSTMITGEILTKEGWFPEGH
jgi:hypothetical protein